MRPRFQKPVYWVMAIAIVAVAAWWALDFSRPSAQELAQPAVEAARDAAAAEQGARAPDDSPVKADLSAASPARLDKDRRRSDPPSRGALALRQVKALELLRETGSVTSMQTAFLALVHPVPEKGPVRAGLEILGGWPEHEQREVLAVLNRRLRPGVREMLEGLALDDPSPPVRRAASIALEAIGNPPPDSDH